MVRVALSGFRWPLDPALADGRDETTLARLLYATPLRVDPASGRVVPGLCSGWEGLPPFRVWRLTCKDAPVIAGALRRVAHLRDAPLRWLFADAEVRAPNAATLIVRLPFSWRRFPYALTAVAAAPRSVPGPFRLVRGSATRVVVRREGLTVLFRRLGARAAVRAFRRGELDEAPVPAGDIAFLKAELGDVVETRRLLALDLVLLRGLKRDLRRAYWQTANRGDYEQLVPERDGSSAFGIVGSDEEADPARFRAAVKSIPSLPRVRVRIGVPPDPALRFAARLLYAQWRDVGLGPQLVTEPASALDGAFRRLISAYPQEEAIPAALVLQEGVGSNAHLRRALAATDQRGALEEVDDELERDAHVVPVAWVVDARLVSPRLEGWRENLLGDVDYSTVRFRASSRRR